SKYFMNVPISIPSGEQIFNFFILMCILKKGSCQLLQIDDACSTYLSTDSQPQVSSALEELCFLVMGFLQKPQVTHMKGSLAFLKPDLSEGQYFNPASWRPHEGSGGAGAELCSLGTATGPEGTAWSWDRGGSG
uniref:Uncharacterized protein n=1 Tax=Anser cygnoides TaxID=8845 RepID=A0A8B9E9E2_ANSCY